jgi:hypothetical protein
MMRCFITPTFGAASENSITRVYSPDGFTAQDATDDIVDFYKKGARAALDAFNEMTGAPDGLWLNPAADTATGDWYARFQAATAMGSEGDRAITGAEQAELLDGTLPPGVPASELNRFVARWNRTLDMIAQGILRPADAPAGSNLDFIDTIVLKEKLILAAQYQQQATAAGFTDPINAIVESIRFRSEAESGGTCARVKIKLDQEAVLSREAFKATLEIDNGTENAIEGIRVTVRVTDGQGNDASALFGMRPPEVSGLSNVDGTGAVAGGASGSASWILVPTVDAAPTEPIQYFVSGEFRYTLNGVAVAIPLSPVPITVNPTARLTLDYFHERDVFSDDPFTDIVEPSIPYNLAIMVHNNGAGEAKNFRITSAQPEIIENEKGLLIDFKIIASEVQGQNIQPSLTVNFGTIPAGGIGVARWLLTSTLQGLFTSYSATFEHLDNHGNPRTSLIDDVRIHRMNRLVQVAGKHAFLVNDIPNLRDLPDTLWLSDGSSNHVQVVTNGVVTGVLSPANLQVQLSAALPSGWAYLRIPDPANGQYRLVSVTRSDSVGINVNNAWVTDRTFRGQGTRPISENILHLLDKDSTGTYTLAYEVIPVADTNSPVSSVESLAAQSKTAFPVNWSGQDDGSGVASFDVYYSENGAPFQRWLAATTANAALFQGSLGKSYAFYSVATDRAGNREPAPAVPQAQTMVAFTNQPPVLAPIAAQSLNAGQTMSLSLSANDADGDAITYAFGASAPPGMVLNAQSGGLNWITSPTQGSSTNQVTVVARDNGFPQLSATQTFLVTVISANHAPTLAAITNYVLPEGRLLTITNIASDSDLPTQTLTFSLGSGAPEGAEINPFTGVFTWRPDVTERGTTNLLSIIVTDSGVPPMSATQSFTVAVIPGLPDFRLGIGSTAIWSNGVGNVPITLQSSFPLTNLQFVLDVSSGRLTNFNLGTLAPEVASANVIAIGSNQFDLQFDRRPDSALQGNFTLSQLGFAAVSNEHSAVVSLRAKSLVAATPATVFTNGAAENGRVFVVGREPILDLASVSNQVALTLYARPGRYVLERNSEVIEQGTNLWTFDSFVDADAIRTDLPLRETAPAREFFRTYEAVGVTVPLSIRLEGGQVIIEWSLDCTGCVLEEAGSMAGPWTPSLQQPQVVNGKYRVTMPPTGTRFLRLQVPL